MPVLPALPVTMQANESFLTGVCKDLIQQLSGPVAQSDRVKDVADVVSPRAAEQSVCFCDVKL